MTNPEIDFNKKESNIIDFAAKKEEREEELLNKKELTAKKKEALSELSNFRGELDSKNQAMILPNVKVGEIFWISNEDKAYVVTENNKKRRVLRALDELASVSTGLTLYDLNRSIVAKEPLLEITEEVRQDIAEKLGKVWAASNNYYLLYGRSIHYFTIFKKNDLTMLEKTDLLLETIGNIGYLVSIDFDEGNQALEIWIKTDDSDAEALFLFPYDKGFVNW